MPGAFYGSVFDAKLIVFQIVQYGALSYVSLAGLLWFQHALFGAPCTPSQFAGFNPTTTSVYAASGWTTLSAHLLNAAIFQPIFLSLVVERAKKCLDFAFTFRFFDFLATCAAWGFPTTFEYWALTCTCLVVTAVFAEWLCMRRELQEISMSEFLSLGKQASRAASKRASSSLRTLQRNVSSLQLASVGSSAEGFEGRFSDDEEGGLV